MKQATSAADVIRILREELGGEAESPDGLQLLQWIESTVKADSIMERLECMERAAKSFGPAFLNADSQRGAPEIIFQLFWPITETVYILQFHLARREDGVYVNWISMRRGPMRSVGDLDRARSIGEENYQGAIEVVYNIAVAQVFEDGG